MRRSMETGRSWHAQEFSSGDPTVAAPDYVGDGGRPGADRAEPYLAGLEGGAGAHSGVFELVDFDGGQLRVQV